MSQDQDQTQRVLRGIAETAQMLGVAQITIFRMIHRGRLRAVKLGGRTLVPDEAIHQFVASLPPAVIKKF